MAKSYRVDFEAIKAGSDFRLVLISYRLKEAGQPLPTQSKIRCPFHEDAEPSCSINRDQRVFHCFGCGAQGNVLDFVQRMETKDGAPVSLKEAAIKLAWICNIDLPSEEDRPGRREARTGAARAKTAPTALNGTEASLAAPTGRKEGNGGERLPKRNKPLGFALTLNPWHPYLDERGIPYEFRERFGLGFCEKGIMAGRVCIPIHNADGAIVAYAGRWVGPVEDLPEGKGKYELPAGFGKELELFNLHRVSDCRHLVVVEGFFGAIRLHIERIPAVALMGTSISVKQLELLAHANARHVTVLLDGDEPGRAAAGEVAAAIANVAWARIVHLPDGVQPDTINAGSLERLLGRTER